MRASLSRCVVACAAVLLFCVGSSRGDDFMVKLSLKNAHLRDVFFGCRKDASSGYDRRIDDFAPPPGIQTGYVGFIPGVKGLPLYYKDIRGSENEQEWQFYVRVHPDKPVTISWDKAEFPEKWTFTVTTKAGVLNMEEVSELTVAETQIVKIHGKLLSEETSGEKPDAVGKNKEKP